MNRQQAAHLKKRLEAMTAQKCCEIDHQYDIARNKIHDSEISKSKKLDLIYAGKVDLKPRSQVESSNYGSGYLVGSFHFPTDERANKDRELLEKAHTKRKEDIKAEGVRIVDVAVFGDASEALKMMAAFEKF